ncbi:MAG: hypothetical protein O7D91_17645 [Planctomycetota bacterium]|nr:hypothetical protein [Planctomycetota bacterium]
MERVENAMVEDGHWSDDNFDAQAERLQERLEAAADRMEDENLQEAFDAQIARMGKLNDELKRVTRFLNGPDDA